MIFATSCENELEVGAAGEESVVSFTIATPDMGSRAYSDGKTATVLQYAVYDAEGNIRYKNIAHTWVNGKCKYCGAKNKETDSHCSTCNALMD